jgi:hypothetical protein
MGTYDSKNYLNLNLADFTDGLSSDEAVEVVVRLYASLSEAGIPVTFTSNGQHVGGDA